MRGRWIKPELWSSTTLSACSLEATLLFVGLCNYADDEGRGLANPTLIRSELYPLRPAVTDENVVQWLEELRRVDSIRFGRARERASGDTRRARKVADVLEIVAWTEHYRSDHPRPSRWDAIPPRRRSSTKAPRRLEEDSTKARGRLASKGRVSKGREVVEDPRGLEENGAGSTPNGAGAYDPDRTGPAPYDVPIPGVLEAEPDQDPETEPKPSPASWRTRPNPWDVPDGKTVADVIEERSS